MAVTDVFAESSHQPLNQVLSNTTEDSPNLQERLKEAEAAADHSAALIDLLSRIDSAQNLRHACFTLTNDLQQFFSCVRVAIGLRRGRAKTSRLQAVSGISQFDRQSDVTKAMEAAFDEAIIRDSVICWPQTEGPDRHGSLTLRKLASVDEMSSVICGPLRDSKGESIGAWAFFEKEPPNVAQDRLKLIHAFEGPVANRIGALERLEPGPIVRTAHACTDQIRTWKGRLIACALLIALAALAIPMPYKMKCDCTVEPVTRRYVAAPFEGTLEESLVKPGDLVSANDVLARMDGREIRWERAGVLADQQQAEKRRDSELATQNYADAQIAKLEVERLDLQLRLLDHRSKNLNIRSPIDGIVTSGDLERAQGAPLKIGETLFEIAPLDEMIIEVAIPDDEIAHTAVGQEIIVNLDAYPSEALRIPLEMVHPRAEIRNRENAFIGEAFIENTDLRLRPGMKGRAKIVTAPRHLGWILFHRPWNALLAWFGF